MQQATLVSEDRQIRNKKTTSTDNSLNRRFNRLESPNGHYYLKNYGAEGVGSQRYSGFIKVKLAHGPGRTIVVPDLLFLGGDASRWIQPLSFSPPMLVQSNTGVKCEFSIDVSCGHRLSAMLSTEGFVRAFDDGSELYRCTFIGPRALQAHATGTSTLTSDNVPSVMMYHHTTAIKKAQILESGVFWLSPWNIQGTQTQVKNVGYAYFTALDKIICEEDLQCIAMSSAEIIYMMVDGFQLPPFFQKGDHPEEVLPLKVYRGRTEDRTETLEFSIDASLFAPQHLLLHTGDRPMWYEIMNPFTQRVGAEPGSTIPFHNNKISRGTFKSKTFRYVVVGDASSIDGLAAPYNEETTGGIFKLEEPKAGTPFLALWFEVGNTDLYSGKTPEMQELIRVQ